MINVTCPYCKTKFEEPKNEIEERIQYEVECPKCKKVFGYSISIHTEPCELPCGGQNGAGPHNWKQMEGGLATHFKNVSYCTYCGLVQIVKEDM